MVNKNNKKRNIGASGERVLVTIGISMYADLNPLQGPAVDVTAFREVMEQQYGFRTLADLRDEEADGSRILDTLQACGDLREDDTLVLYYAGHGRSIEFYGMNYWLPYDAEEQEIRTWIPSSMVSGALERIPARHILLLNDSCFSGDLLRVRRNFRERKPGYEETAKRYRAREVLTSGISEPVTDAELGGHSPFAWHLLDALRSNRERWIDAWGLYEYVKRGLVGQTPLYGTLQGHQDGGACLLYRQAEHFPGKSIPPSAFWESAEKSERTEAVLATLNREELPVVQVYKCPICGKDYLCRDHFDKELRCCEECAETKREAAAQEAEAKRKAEEERKAVVKRKKEQEQREEAKREEEQRQAAQKRLERGLVPMTYVEGGSFQMGSDYVVATSDEQPVHKVLVDDFYLGKYPVTQEQYQKVTGKNPSDFDSARDSSNRPVAHVSWYDAVVFCNRLSIREGRKPAYELGGSSDPDRWGTAPNDDSPRWDSVKVNWEANGYRLPTEAEWEFAARGGVKSRGYRYAGSNYPNEVAWYCDNAVHGMGAVGEKRPNELGLYDMSGNVYEWCWDWYDGDYYKQSPAANPRGPVSGSTRVLRGGCWGDFAPIVRTANRSNGTPSDRYPSFGFRVLAPAV